MQSVTSLTAALQGGFAMLLLTGTAMLLVVGSCLVMMVRELAPAGSLARLGRWGLAAGLGTGIAAFAAKLGLIVLMLAMPDRLMPTPGLREAQAALTPPPAAPATAPAPETGRYVWQALPATAPIPAHNPQTPEKVRLGEALFTDKRLSRTGEASCASCHDVQNKAGGDARAAAVGIEGRQGRRNSPTVWNAAFQSVLFWDGRAPSLEEQAKGPLINPDEMGMPSWQAVEARVEADPEYRAAFAQVFGAGTSITIDRIAEAIAAYERTLVSGDTPYDRFVRGEREALTASQLRGMALFERQGCVSCHGGPNFSDAAIGGTGAPFRIFPAKPEAIGEYRFDSDNGVAGQQVWRIPTLRNVALTGPWFHDGSVDDLREAVRIMAQAQLGAVVADGADTLGQLRWSAEQRVLLASEPRILTQADLDDLVAFLHALSSERLVTASARHQRVAAAQ